MYRRFLTLAMTLILSLLFASACGLLPGSQDAEAPDGETGSEESAESDEDADVEPGDAEEPPSDATDAEPGNEDANGPDPDDPQATETEGDTADTPPSADDVLVGEVISGGYIRTQPDLADEVVQGEVCPGDSLTIFEEQTTDEITWYRVRVTAAAADCVANHIAVDTEGWISSVLVTEPVSATVSAPSDTEPADASDPPPDVPEPTTVNVTKGGYIRTQPLIADETVQGELCMGDTVQILEDQVADDILWYRIRVESVVVDCVPNHVAAGTEGWVSDLLLGTP